MFLDTTKLSIIANAQRVIELLHNDEHGSELINKMHELRRDTIRLEGLIKGLYRTCKNCHKEVKFKNSYETTCFDCQWENQSK